VSETPGGEEDKRGSLPLRGMGMVKLTKNKAGERGVRGRCQN